MKLIHKNTTKMSQFNKNATGTIYSLAFEISDLNKRVAEMHQIITDTSWLAPLDIIDKLTFEARSKPTIDKVVNHILNKVQDTISDEFGEYMVSDSAQTILNNHLDHIRAPLAELIKEKISGNPGFDFHTESPDNIVAFGEAKYSGVRNSHGRALKQINEFILAKKDIQELSDLRKFLSKLAVLNAAQGKKSFCAAFSIISDDVISIMENALESSYVTNLLCYEAIYLVGVKIRA